MATVTPKQSDHYDRSNSFAFVRTKMANSSTNPPEEVGSAAKAEQEPGGKKRVYSASDPNTVALPSPASLPPAKRQKIDAQPADSSKFPSIHNLIHRANSSESAEQQPQEGILPAVPIFNLAVGLNPSHSLQPLPSHGNQSPRSSAASSSNGLSSLSGSDPLAEAKRCLDTSTDLMKDNQFDAAIQATLDGLKFEHSDRQLKGLLYLNQVCIFKKAKLYDKALQAHQNSLEFELDDLNQAKRSFHLGNVYVDMKQYDKAIPPLQEGLLLGHTDPYLTALLNLNLGLSFHGTEQNDNALQAIRDGLQIEHDDPELKARLYGLLGMTLIVEKRYAEAVAELTKGFSISNDPALEALKKSISGHLLTAQSYELKKLNALLNQ
jgi:tetratricopeptide (TPR) repeat protein